MGCRGRGVNGKGGEAECRTCDVYGSGGEKQGGEGGDELGPGLVIKHCAGGVLRHQVDVDYIAKGGGQSRRRGKMRWAVMRGGG